MVGSKSKATAGGPQSLSRQSSTLLQTLSLPATSTDTSSFGTLGDPNIWLYLTGGYREHTRFDHSGNSQGTSLGGIHPSMAPEKAVTAKTTFC